LSRHINEYTFLRSDGSLIGYPYVMGINIFGGGSLCMTYSIGNCSSWNTRHSQQGNVGMSERMYHYLRQINFGNKLSKPTGYYIWINRKRSLWTANMATWTDFA